MEAIVTPTAVVILAGSWRSWQRGAISYRTYQEIFVGVFAVLFLYGLNAMDPFITVGSAICAIWQSIILHRERPRPLWWKGQHERIETEEN